MSSIDRDLQRFKNIVKGRMRKNLKEFIKNGKQVIQKGRDQFSVPMPIIETPRFKFGSNQGGVGEGEGEEGAGIGPEPGDAEGNKEREETFTAEELGDILGEELELPRIEPKGEQQIAKKIFRYNTLGINGPQSLKHMKKTFFNSLKRSIASGNYDPKNPSFLPQKKDFRFKSFTVDYEYESSATIFHIMDVSGSMGTQQKEIVRNTSFWINIWLKANYKNIKIRYIIHDTTAKEVDEETFFSTQESGGTKISSAYDLLKEIITKEKIMDNLYVFQFSDGDNFDERDNTKCIDMLNDYFLKTVNLFGYTQVKSSWGTGLFLKVLEKHLSNLNKSEELVKLSYVEGHKDILHTIKDLLGK